MPPTWLWLSAILILSWGTLGLFQKLAVNHIPASAALIWAAVGFMLLQPFLFPGASIFEYSWKSLSLALLNGVFNGLGFLSLTAAMRNGGKASVVEPLTGLYPVFVVLLAPALLHEHIKPIHALGISCAIVGGMLLSAETTSAIDGNVQKPTAERSKAAKAGG
jgi:transporter family protein